MRIEKELQRSKEISNEYDHILTSEIYKQFNPNDFKTPCRFNFTDVWTQDLLFNTKEYLDYQIRNSIIYSKIIQNVTFIIY
jgi:hypothetical protein